MIAIHSVYIIPMINIFNQLEKVYFSSLHKLQAIDL